MSARTRICSLSNRTDITEEVVEMNIVIKTDFWKKLTPLNILLVFHLWVIGIVIVVTTIASIFVPPLFYINENQILYGMSCLAQVTAALFALILAAYTIADTRLKNMAANDETLLDYIPELQNEYYYIIIRISVNCLATSLLCFVTLNVYDNLSQKLFSVLMVDTGVLGAISIVSLMLFVWAVCDPKAFQQKGEAIKDEMDQAYAGNMSTDDFKMFLGYYNRLESLINKYAAELLDDNSVYKYQRKRMLIFPALDILMSRGIFDEYIYLKIDEFRRYRNALVHSMNPESINSGIYNELKEVYELLKKVYLADPDEKDKSIHISKLSDYCKEHIVNELDRKVIDYLQSHYDAKLNDIAQGIGVSKATATKSIRKLVQTGMVHVVGSSGTGKSYNLTETKN